jgi:hypothetical protein
MVLPRVLSRAAGQRAIRTVVAAFALAISALTAGCGDLASADITLDSTALRADFGAATGSIPPLACTAGNAGPCAAVPAPAGVSGWQVGCDATAGQCFGQADFRVQQSVAVTTPSSLDSQLGRDAVPYLHGIDVAYTIPSNTLTFALARIQLFVVTNGAAAGDGGTAVGDGGVILEAAPAQTSDVLVGNVDPLAAGQVVADARHLSIGEGTPAFTAIADQVQAGQNLSLAVVASPRVVAGTRLPAGAVEVLCQPTLHFAVRWSQIF